MPAEDSKRRGIEVLEIRERLQMSRESFADAVGLSADTIRHYEQEHQPVSDAAWASIKNFEKLKATSPFHELKEPAPQFGSIMPFPATPRRKVPVVSWARAGGITERGLNYGDLAQFIDETVETDSKDPNAFGLIIEGDSMSPEYLPGDRVVFAPNEIARNGDVVVARLRENGEVYFKCFRRTGAEGDTVILESINKDYKPMTFKYADFRFIYPAVDMLRKIRR
jgi:SOS-response transcriptional repressor LexA